MGLTLSNITKSIIHKADHTDAGGRIVPDRQSIAAAFADANGTVDTSVGNIQIVEGTVGVKQAEIHAGRRGRIGTVDGDGLPRFQREALIRRNGGPGGNGNIESARGAS